MRPTVSVVVPTFNRAGLVVNALESVYAQTYRDYEVIVVDDGSTDDTRHKLQPYMDRIRYIYQDNQGASAARNAGIKVARGEWISTLDSDDMWLPTKLERQFEALTELGGDFGACFTDCQFAGDPSLHKTAFELGGLDRAQLFGILDNAMHYVLARYPVIWIQSLLVQKSLVEELGRFDESIVITQDTDLIFQLALKTKFCFVAEPLVKVDRTPSRQGGLIDLLRQGQDKGFSDRERMYKKWLGMSEVADPALRARILGLLRGLYSDWMIRKIYQLSFPAMFEKMKLAREIGVSNLGIFSELTFRAGRRITRPFPRQDRIP